jgi:hypothetical protein
MPWVIIVFSQKWMILKALLKTPALATNEQSRLSQLTKLFTWLVSFAG